MFELYVSGPFAFDATDPRNQFHERALREARIAHDYLEHSSPESIPAERTGMSIVSRLRLAVAGGPAIATTEACSCPA